jgi:hypothetical protein
MQYELGKVQANKVERDLHPKRQSLRSRTYSNAKSMRDSTIANVSDAGECYSNLTMI